MANVGLRAGVAMPMRGLSWQDETAEDNHPNRDKDDRYMGVATRMSAIAVLWPTGARSV
jgi:hypothetical protein